VRYLHGPCRGNTVQIYLLDVSLLRQVAARTSKAGTTAFMKGRSFGVFGIRNRLRLLVFRTMFSQVKQRLDPAHLAAVDNQPFMSASTSTFFTCYH